MQSVFRGIESTDTLRRRWRRRTASLSGSAGRVRPRVSRGRSSCAAPRRGRRRGGRDHPRGRRPADRAGAVGAPRRARRQAAADRRAVSSASIAARAAATHAAPSSRPVSSSAYGISFVRRAWRISSTPAASTSGPTVPGGLVDDAAHRRVGRLLEHHPQPRAVQRVDLVGGPARGAEQPQQDRHVVQRVAQRPDDVGVADQALGPGRLDRRARLRTARDRPHRVALGGQARGRGRGRGTRRRRRAPSRRPAAEVAQSRAGPPRRARRPSSSVSSSWPRARRRELIASRIWSRSSISFWTSTSTDRVGRQSSCSAPEPGANRPSRSSATSSAADDPEHDQRERVHRRASLRSAAPVSGPASVRAHERGTEGHRRRRRRDDGRGDRAARRAVGRAHAALRRRCRGGRARVERIPQQLDRGAERGRWSAEDAAAARERLEVAAALEDLAACELVIEAAPERWSSSASCSGRSREIAPRAVLASNTSSIPITAIAAGRGRPDARRRHALLQPGAGDAARRGHRRPRVLDGGARGRARRGRGDGQARDRRRRRPRLPGQPLQPAVRPRGAEARCRSASADVETIDRICRLGGGFRMGPFELQDLVGIDVGFEVAQSFYELSFGEPRWRPSPLERADGRRRAPRPQDRARLVRRTTATGRTARGPGAARAPAAATGGSSSSPATLPVADELRALAASAGYAAVEPLGAEGEVPWLAIDCGAEDDEPAAPGRPGRGPLRRRLAARARPGAAARSASTRCRRSGTRGSSS